MARTVVPARQAVSGENAPGTNNRREKECQARDLDAPIAYTTIVMTRYLFLALEQRRHADPRTLGLLFHACCEEMRGLEYLEALRRIVVLAATNLMENRLLSEQLCQLMIAEVLHQASCISRLRRGQCQRSEGVEW